jgi:carboxyl-terminal processing protease
MVRVGAARRAGASRLVARALLAPLLAAAIGGAWAQPASGASVPGGPAAVAFERTFDAAVALVREHYWDDEHLDWDAWAAEHRATAAAASDRAAFDAVMRRLLRALDDDHSAWLGVTAADGAAPTDVGPGPPRLGVQFGFAPGRGLVVERVYPSTPAATAGLRRADVVVAVGGAPLGALGNVFEADGVLRSALEAGPATLTVERRRVRLEVEVVAESVPFAAIVGAPYGHMLDERTGYLAVPSFNGEGVAASAHAALAELVEAGAVTLVLDVRGNLGGRLLEAGALLGAFLQGTWADAVARGAPAWTAQVEHDGDALVSRLVTAGGTVMAQSVVPAPAVWRGPVVVVVGSETVSAGELVALALQDRGRARVVGERTAGNVEAVQGFTLPDGSRLLLAVADLRGPNGLAFAMGVVPDVVARAEPADLARGLDAPVSEARRLLGALPFTPDRRF